MAISQYPALKSINPAQVTTRLPGDQRMLEFWGPGEGGGSDFQRPPGLPMDRPGVQVISPSTRPEDVAADLVSHYMVNQDQKLKPQYQAFANTFTTPDGRARLQEDYAYSQQNEKSMYPNGMPPIDEWAQRSRIPAYFRGYVFNQWPQDSFKSMYSPDQIQMLDQMKSYLTGAGQ